MRPRLWLLLSIGLGSVAEAAGGFVFGGFSADGTRFLKQGGDERECTVALPPACKAIDKKAAKEAGFAKPARTRKLGGENLEAVVEDGAVVVRAGDRIVGRFEAEPPATSVNANVFVSPGGGLI